MTAKKVNCWEHMRCGREPGGANEQEFGPCPAATDSACDGINEGTNAGRFCWAVPRTLCTGEVEGDFEEKFGRCHSCAFFRRTKYEEAYHFHLVEPGLGVSDTTVLHRLLNNMTMLVGVYRDVFACLAVGPLLTTIAKHASRMTRASSAAVYLLDDAGKVLLLKAQAGSVSRPGPVAVEADVPLGEAIRTGTLRKGPAGPDAAAQVAAIPIGGHQKVIGALELLKVQGQFSPDDEWFGREFAMIAALGIEDAQHVQNIRQLKEFDKAKSRFVALLMHHIISPLATIACSLQAIRQLDETLSREDRRELIDCSLERISSIQALSKKLLNLAAIRRGTSLTDIRPVRPIEPLREEIESQSARAREKGVEIVVADDAEDARVSADPDGLRLLFANLLGNAIKYSAGPGKTVHVDLATRGGHVRIRFRDRGIGIPADERQKVFEEFHRASNVADAGASGFGVGLALVKELVDRYDGRIEIDSELGVGTTVSVELPLAADGGA